MTNHPRSPRHNFKVGQVVKIFGEYRHITQIDTQSRAEDHIVFVRVDGTWFDSDEVKPLTKKEAGR